MPIQKKILNACDNLPEACSSFLLETGIERAISTRWAYAQELMWFFDYLISYKPEYCDMISSRLVSPAKSRKANCTTSPFFKTYILSKSKVAVLKILG